MTVLIRYGYGHCKTIEADDFKNCIIEFASFIGIDRELFEKALVGCTSEIDCIEMLERFSEDKIKAVYTIQETIYEE